MENNKKNNVNNRAKTTTSQDVVEIDLLELGEVLLAHKFQIIFFTLLGALIVNAYSFFMIDPSYESTAKLYIVSTSNGSVVDLTDLNIGTSLTKDYEELIFSYPVIKEVMEKLDLDIEEEAFKEMIALENPADTRVLCITVTSNDPALSRDIANTLVNIAIKYLPETMSSNPPNIAQRARLESDRVAPSYAKSTAIGGLIGLMLACIYFTMLYVMDDTIRTAEAMEKAFGIMPLTSIPRSDKLEDNID